MAELSNIYTWIVLFVTIGFGLVGFSDDFRKLTKRSSNGVPAKVRLAIQIIISFDRRLRYHQCRLSRHGRCGRNTLCERLHAPLRLSLHTFRNFVIVGASNAVNLTDGLDGLATVPVIIAALCFIIITYLVGNLVFANYLQIHHVQGAGELSVFCGALVGACLGFLWFNAPPAQVFMGDTGSLSLGSALGTIAVIVNMNWFWPLSGDYSWLKPCRWSFR